MSAEARSPQHRLSIAGEDDIVLARQRARDLARRLGFGMIDQSRIATAVSELTRNVVRYATDKRGEVHLTELRSPDGTAGLEIVVADHGPGIPDVERAMQEGFTSGPGLGMGLPGTKRLMDEMDVDSVVGRGTIVTVRKWRR
ncbi:MAG TPA: anti-sigma regulatory factor [Chloroflexota bacterium]|nr:anti-sigma regulatory factor [Chloroflexota bacterium]